MRIGVVAPVWVSVPPEGYGGTELVVSLLVEELVARGHDVTLFASGDSRTKAALRSAFDVAPTHRLWEIEPDALHVGTAYGYAAEAYESGEGFDLIHDHTDYLGVAFGGCIPTPVLHTVHTPLDEDRRLFLERFRDDVYLSAVSDHQMSECPKLPWRGRVYDAVDIESFTFSERKGDYLLSIGRISAGKGTDLAIEVALRTHTPLVLAGRVHPRDSAFFTERVLPHIDGDRVSFLGEIPGDRKRELLAGARALLMPVREPEPFGLVSVEAMASGTPVVGAPRGAVPEVVLDGETGFLVDDVDSMVDAVTRVDEIDPARCRRHVEERFLPGTMVDGYEAIYRELLAEL
jgi:glycosyltransferase involved in cell wall biosynthesis